MSREDEHLQRCTCPWNWSRLEHSPYCAMHPESKARPRPDAPERQPPYVPFSKRPRSIALEKVAAAAKAYVLSEDEDRVEEFNLLSDALAELDATKPPETTRKSRGE